MLAPRYRVPVNGLVIEMGPPIKRQEVEVLGELMSSPKVSRYLGRSLGYTPEDEYTWFDKIREQKKGTTWLLFDVTDGKRVLIGSTGYHSQDMPLHTVTSGCQIARPEYWGRGIAGKIHRVRTWHAFARQGVVCIRSAVNEPNLGSKRALESVGYVQVGLERNQGLDDGVWISKFNFECINPDRFIWQQWWHGDPVPPEFLQARKKSRAALKWVREVVKPFDS